MVTEERTEHLQCKVWRDGELVCDRVEKSRIVEALHDPHSLVWLDLAGMDCRHLAHFQEDLGLYATEIEDAVAPHERAKVSRRGDHLFFTAYSVELTDGSKEDERLVTRRISGFVLPSALVTIRDEEFDVEPAERAWAANHDLLRFGPRALVHGLLDAMVDQYFETIQQMDDEIEDLEDELFEENHTNQHFQRRVYALRKDLVALRRVILPMREVVNGLLRHGGRTDTELDSWYDDLYDHVLRVAEWTESLRDMITSVFETNLSLQDARLNTVMKKLAAWAAIIAVPTAITGWFGQNVPYPGFSDRFGFILSVVLIVVLSGALYIAFRKRDWL